MMYLSLGSLNNTKYMYSSDVKVYFLGCKVDKVQDCDIQGTFAVLDH